MSAKSKLAVGRLIVKKKQPYLASAIYAMAPVAVPGLGTTAVTETMAFLYDPEVVENEWSDDDCATAIAHEVGHLMRDHIGRGNRYGINALSKDARLWNIAGDVCINDDLLAAGFKLLESDWTSTNLKLEKNKTVEYNYEQLKKNPPPEPPGHTTCCGSGSGHALKNEPQVIPPNHPAHRPKADVVRTRRAVAEAVKSEAAKGRGNIPGGWVRWAELEFTPPKIPWQTKYARCGRNKLATKMGDVDYVYDGISHLQGGLGFGPGVPILPVMRAPDLEVIVVVDTSGSMGKPEIQASGSEAVAIMRTTGGRVIVVACDCQVHAWKECRGIDDIVAVIGTGGGGTSFVPAFEEIAKRKKKPDLVVFMTDGQGDAPLEPPPYDVIWLLVGRHRQQPEFGGWGNKGGETWGEMIEIDDHDEKKESM